MRGYTNVRVISVLAYYIFPSKAVVDLSVFHMSFSKILHFILEAPWHSRDLPFQKFSEYYKHMTIFICVSQLIVVSVHATTVSC